MLASYLWQLLGSSSVDILHLCTSVALVFCQLLCQYVPYRLLFHKRSNSQM